MALGLLRFVSTFKFQGRVVTRIGGCTQGAWDLTSSVRIWNVWPCHMFNATMRPWGIQLQAPGDMPHFKHGHQRDPEQLGVTLGWQSAEYVLDNLMLNMISKMRQNFTHHFTRSQNQFAHTHTQSGSALPLKGYHYVPTAKPPCWLVDSGAAGLQDHHFLDWWKKSDKVLLSALAAGFRSVMRQSHRPKRCSHFKMAGSGVSLVRPGREGYVSTYICLGCILVVYKFCFFHKLFPYAPWCWHIYQHLPWKSPSFVGKYSSTLEHLRYQYRWCRSGTQPEFHGDAMRLCSP